jgi:hypothetical protein
MYGNNWDIPGFRWFDKGAQRSVLCKLPGSVRAIQERISAGRTGLLRDGSSYTNLFDGDARLALFTLSALGRDRLLENVRGLGFLILFGLGPLRILRIVVLSLWTWLVYVIKRVGALLRPGIPHFTFLGPFLEILSNIIFREVTTFSVMVDIYRGMPSVYASYTGYDEIAHHFGATSREAFQALRGVDKQVRQIDRIRHLYARRDYRLYILSDHGMTTSLSFRRAYDQTLEQFIATYTGKEVDPGEPWEETEGLPLARAYFLIEEIRALEARPHRPVPARILRATRQQLEERMLAGGLQPDWDLSRHSDIVVRSSGSLSHIYFNVTPRKMALSEVALLYPQFLRALVDHDGIGLVVGHEGPETMLMGRSGSLRAGPTDLRLEGEHPLAHLPDPDWAVGQVVRLASFPHAGDLILLGKWDGERLICFEEQAASHGGLGGPQDWPFLAYPPEERLIPQAIKNSEEVYARLTRIHGRYA